VTIVAASRGTNGAEVANEQKENAAEKRSANKQKESPAAKRSANEQKENAGAKSAHAKRSAQNAVK
jgi:hypothetical protein